MPAAAPVTPAANSICVRCQPINHAAAARAAVEATSTRMGVKIKSSRPDDITVRPGPPFTGRCLECARAGRFGSMLDAGLQPVARRRRVADCESGRARTEGAVLLSTTALRTLENLNLVRSHPGRIGRGRARGQIFL